MQTFADNREAVITAEAVEDLDTLRFLMEHQIYQFQANILFGKMTVSDYKRDFDNLHSIHEDIVREVLTDKILSEKQKKNR